MENKRGYSSQLNMGRKSSNTSYNLGKKGLVKLGTFANMMAGFQNQISCANVFSNKTLNSAQQKSKKKRKKKPRL